MQNRNAWLQPMSEHFANKFAKLYFLQLLSTFQQLLAESCHFTKICKKPTESLKDFYFQHSYLSPSLKIIFMHNFFFYQKPTITQERTKLVQRPNCFYFQNEELIRFIALELRVRKYGKNLIVIQGAIKLLITNDLKFSIHCCTNKLHFLPSFSFLVQTVHCQN